MVIFDYIVIVIVVVIVAYHRGRRRRRRVVVVGYVSNATPNRRYDNYDKHRETAIALKIVHRTYLRVPCSIDR